MDVKSGVTARGHTTNIFIIMFALFGLCDSYGFYSIPIILTLIMPILILDFDRKDTVICWRVLGIPLSLMNMSVLLPPIFLVLLMDDQKKLVGPAGNVAKWIIVQFKDVVNHLEIPLFAPVMGYNSSELFKDQIEEFRTNYRNMIDSITLGEVTQCEYMRPPGISMAPIPIAKKLDVTGINMKNMHDSIVRITRQAVLAAVTAFLFLFIGVGALLAGALLYLVFGLENSDDFETRAERGITFKDGVYRVGKSIFGIEYTHGIGTSHGGVLHVPYHVCNANKIMYGKAKVGPYYIDVKADLVCYGGPPMFSQPKEEMKVYANCETSEARVSYEVDLALDEDQTLIWYGMTRPGESGSPLYGVTEDGIELLGLCGRYYQQAGDDPMEFSYRAPVEVESGVERIVTYPGSGKTHHELPKLLKRKLPMMNGKKILVTGPTRVVCRELYESVSKIAPVGLNIKDTSRRNEQLQIQIAAHMTSLRMLESESRAVAGLGLIVIDEAHVDDVATIMLRRYARANDIPLVEMSATLDGVCANGSRYPIDDVKIEDRAVISTTLDELEKGNRVMVFVSGTKNRHTKLLLEKTKEYQPVILSRATYEAAMRAIGEKTEEGYRYRLIISTDIAECGINVPELDVVIDTTKKFKYVVQGSIINGMEIIPNQASVTQRRGRVGRTRRGTYYFVEPPATYDVKTSAEFDADVLCTGRSWNQAYTNDWGLRLSDKQYAYWLKNADMSPTWVYLTVDNLGRPRSEQRKREEIDKWREGCVNYIGCGKSTCPCKGMYRFFDERNHDAMYLTKAYELY